MHEAAINAGNRSNRCSARHRSLQINAAMGPTSRTALPGLPGRETANEPRPGNLDDKTIDQDSMTPRCEARANGRWRRLAEPAKPPRPSSTPARRGRERSRRRPSEKSRITLFAATAVQGGGRRTAGLTASGYVHLPSTARRRGRPGPRGTSHLAQLRRPPPHPSDFPPLPTPHPMLSRGRRGLGFPCRGHPPSSSAATRTTTSRQRAARIER